MSALLQWVNIVSLYIIADLSSGMSEGERARLMEIAESAGRELASIDTDRPAPVSPSIDIGATVPPAIELEALRMLYKSIGDAISDSGGEDEYVSRVDAAYDLAQVMIGPASK